MDTKIKIEYSTDKEITTEQQELLRDIINCNSSRWVIAIEAFCLGIKNADMQREAGR